MENARLYFGLVLVGVAAACNMGLRQGLIERAAFDAKCPKEDVRIERMSEDHVSAEVEACGQMLNYQDVSPRGEHGGPPNWMRVLQ
jgi:hypothetical protein